MEWTREFGGPSAWARMVRVVADRRAQDLAEYGIALAVIGTAAVLAAAAIEHNVGDHLWRDGARIIRRVANGTAGS